MMYWEKPDCRRVVDDLAYHRGKTIPQDSRTRELAQGFRGAYVRITIDHFVLEWLRSDARGFARARDRHR